MKGRKRNRTAVFAVFLAGIMLAGCGGSKTPSVDEGMAAVESLDYNTALQCFDKAMVEGEDLRLLYRGQGLAYMGLIQYDKAVEAFEKALGAGNGRVDAIDYDINYYLAASYYKLGETSKSIGVYDAIIALNPKDKLAYRLRGSVLAPNNFDKAKEDFDKAVSLDKEDYDQLIDIYLVLERNGYKAAGQEYFQTALASDTKSMTDYQRGRMYYYLEDYDNARNYLEKARDAGGYEAVLFLGKTYETLGDNNYAISVYNACLDSEGPNAQVLNQLGLCRMQTGDYSGALNAFQNAMNIENNGMMQILKMNEIYYNTVLANKKKYACIVLTLQVFDLYVEKPEINM